MPDFLNRNLINILATIFYVASLGLPLFTRLKLNEVVISSRNLQIKIDMTISSEFGNREGGTVAIIWNLSALPARRWQLINFPGQLVLNPTSQRRTTIWGLF